MICENNYASMSSWHNSFTNLKLVTLYKFTTNAFDHGD